MFPSLRVLAPAYFHCQAILLPQYYLEAGNMRMKKKERRNGIFFHPWILDITFPAPWARLPLNLALHYSVNFWDLGYIELRPGAARTKKHDAGLLVLWIVMFFHNISAIYFLAFSNSCSCILSTFWSSVQWERKEGIHYYSTWARTESFST